VISAFRCLGFFLLAAAGAAQADEPYTWKNVTVGGGGFSPGIAFSPAEKGLAYLRTDIGGAYRWDDRAKRWIPIEDGIDRGEYMEVESIAPDPADPNVVYLAAGTREAAAILRSRDRGTHWQIFPTRFKMGGNEAGRGLGERLAVDPNDTSLLYFGSRNDGLEKSADAGANWSPILSFPQKGLGIRPRGDAPNAGLSFVLFVPSGEKKNIPTRTIVVASADPGVRHLFRSDDAGESWTPVPGEPRGDLLPVKAAFDGKNTVYIAYSNSIGPNGATDGAVFKLDVASNRMTDITPDRDAKRPPGGYMAIDADRAHPGTAVVATLNRYHPKDTVWRTTDGGITWKSLEELSHRDVSATPFLIWGHQWGNTEADFGWWIAALAIDPFDSGHVAYTTGATVYATDELRNADARQPLIWKPWVAGVEETAILALTSPASGPHLVSGFGDIAGFVHDDLDRSPDTLFTDPIFSNTNTIDYAGMAPNVLVRGGTAAPRAKGYSPTLAYSLDSGKSWAPLVVPPLRGTNDKGEIEARHYDAEGDAAVVVSADGATFVVMTPVPLLTRDRGATWTALSTLPMWAHVVADRVDSKRFYAVDFANGTIRASDDGGATFATLDTTGLSVDPHTDWPTWREAQWPLMATPGIAGDLWFRTGAGRLLHSADGGRSFREVVIHMNIEALGFGKAPPASTYPALFSFGWQGQIRGVWRSDDAGRDWKRINDDAHQYGRRFRSICGDPRIFGRVYLGTDGRGLFYGDPVK